jgi:hypothetical protein
MILREGEQLVAALEKDRNNKDILEALEKSN